MGRYALATTVGLVSLFSAFHASSATAQDLIWQVENPFRFFKSTKSFALHEAAFNSVRGNPSGPLPADVIPSSARTRSRRRFRVSTGRL